MAEFLTTPLGILVIIIAQILLVVAFVMISLLFLVYGDRKIWAAVQMRRGPNVVGPWGVLQSVADALKYIVKEVVIPSGADRTVFLLAPLGVNTPMFAGSDSEWQRMAAGPVREPEEVAVQVSDAMTEGRFLILTDPIAQEWMERKTNDLERWLRGMRRLQDRMDELGITNAAAGNREESGA